MALSSAKALSSGDNGPSLIASVVARYKKDPALSQPLSWSEYLLRAEKIARLAKSFGASNNFGNGVDMNPTTLRLVTGMISSRMQRGSFKAQHAQPISLLREMSLLTFEAKPRLISFCMQFTSSDFICYIYQDIILKSMVQEQVLPRSALKSSFEKNLGLMRRWMQKTPSRTGVNSTRRHIRRRLMALLDRTNHQAAALFFDQETSSELFMLIQKLMERDDDVGYTQGMIRDFRDVRADFNLLAEHCRAIRIAHQLSVTKEDDTLLSRIVCPASVENIEEYQIDLPRGPAAGGLREKKDKKNNSGLVKPALKKETVKKESPNKAPLANTADLSHEALIALLQNV